MFNYDKQKFIILLLINQLPHAAQQSVEQSQAVEQSQPAAAQEQPAAAQEQSVEQPQEQPDE
jgi:hypothetical protein